MKFLFRKRKRHSLPDVETILDSGPDKSTPQFSDGSISMSSEGLHAPREKLSQQTYHMHQAISSLMEELEAVDWYRQRADDCDDPQLQAILLHNMREEIEHAAMALEWIRRNDETFDKELREYLFSDGDIVAVENKAMGRK